VVRRSIGGLIGNIGRMAVNDDNRRSIHETVDERRIRVLKYLLNTTGELIRRLGLIVILHRNDKQGLDFFGSGADVHSRNQKSEHS
jgi:hypothetical protein